MWIRFIEELNTPHAYAAKGTECDREAKAAKKLIKAGIAEAIKKPEAAKPKKKKGGK